MGIVWVRGPIVGGSMAGYIRIDKYNKSLKILTIITVRPDYFQTVSRLWFPTFFIFIPIWERFPFD